MNTKKKITVLSILIALILVVTTTSVTFAIWSSKHISNANVISSSCINIEFKDLTNEITLNNAYPMTGLDFSNNEQDYYAFVVTNKCDSVVSYSLNLETLEGSEIESDKLKVVLDGFNIGEINADSFEEYMNESERVINESISNGTYESLNIVNFPEERIIMDNGYYRYLPVASLSYFSDTTPTLDNTIYSKNLNNYVIKPHETHMYDMSMYLSEDVGPGEVQNKTWIGKITINSTIASPIKVSFDSDGGELDVSNKIVSTGESYGELPKPTKEGYVFKYWYLDNDESKGINEDSIVYNTSNHTLKAKYVSKDTRAILQGYTFNVLLNTDDILDINITEDTVIKLLPFEGSFSHESEMHDKFDKIIYYNSENTYETECTGLNCNRTGKYKIYIFREYDSINNIVNLYYWCPNANIAITLDRFGVPASSSLDTYHYYKNLKKVDLSGIDTSLMTYMSYMFYGCESLEEVILDGIDTSNVTEMEYMFEDCKKLKYLDLSNFVTNNVEDMTSMFLNCSSLKTINLSSFDTTYVNSMEDMFKNCTSLEKIDLSSFKDDSLNTIESMFEGCTSLKEINLSGFSGERIFDNHMLCDTNIDNIIGYPPSDRAYSCMEDNPIVPLY